MILENRRRTVALASFFAVMYLVQSLGDPGSGVIAQPVRNLLKNAGENTESIALFMGIVGLPWAMKPVFGVLSDFVPIFGSRRKSYLILATFGAFLGTAILAGAPVIQSSVGWLLALLLLTSIGVAFGDVLIDGLMVTEGQPTGMTGVLQSVQWTAAYAGLLATGVMGGYIAQIGRPELAFGLCALLWAVSLLMAVFMVKDSKLVSPVDLSGFRAALAEVVKTKGLIPVAAFLFVWNFNPLWTSVLYIHLTESLGRTEIEFGEFISAFSFGAMIGSLTYPLYCRRMKIGHLIQLSIVAGVLGNLLYLLLASKSDQVELFVALITGATYMAGTMVQLDIAARRAPLVAAATVFSLLMALSNLSSSASEAFGGSLYQAQLYQGAWTAYAFVVAASTIAPALCWLLIPWLRREAPEWFASTTTTH